MIYLITISATHPAIFIGIRFLLAGACILGIFAFSSIPKKLFWLVVVLLLIGSLFRSYFYSSNHYFLAIYTSLFLFLYHLKKDSNVSTGINFPRALLTIVFFFAAFQKLISPYFMSGRLLADYFLSGSTFIRPMQFLFPGFIQYTNAYNDQLKFINYDALQLGTTEVSIDIPENFIMMCRVIGFSIIALELLLFLLIVFNRSFHFKHFAIFLLLFVWGTFLIRDEYSFFGLLGIIYLFSTQNTPSQYKIAVFLSVCFFLALDVSELTLKI